MHDWKIIFLLSVLVIAVYFPVFDIFFAQDDFIMIRYFSQNSLAVDLANVFGPPTVSHFRPVDNLFYMIAGNIFGKYYFGYHLINISLHILTSFFIFKIFKKLFGNWRAGLFSGVVYGLHPIHFVSLFWISGGTVTIGFFFLTLAIYSLLFEKRVLAFVFYFLSVFASESMLIGIFIFGALLVLLKKFLREKVSLLAIFMLSILFAAIRFVFLTPKSTFDTYKIEFSTKILSAVKYYVLRIPGFVEGYGKSFVSIILVIWLIVLGLNFFNKRTNGKFIRQLLFAIFVTALGLFPFIFIPNHLSSHYMNISVWGFSIILGLFVIKMKNRSLLFLATVFLFISYLSIRLNMQNSWVINRSNLSRELIYNIERENLPPGSTITFDDDEIVSSFEKYIALGTGDAINFWFSDKNYKGCFTFIEDCSK